MHHNIINTENSILQIKKIREKFSLDFNEMVELQKEVKRIKIKKEVQIINQLRDELESPVLKRAMNHKLHHELLLSIIDHLNDEQFEESKSLKKLNDYVLEIQKIKNLQLTFELEQMNLVYQTIKNTEFEELKCYLDTDQFKNIIF